jgi:hypothetical protein
MLAEGSIPEPASWEGEPAKTEKRGKTRENTGKHGTDEFIVIPKTWFMLVDLDLDLGARGRKGAAV